MSGNLTPQSRAHNRAWQKARRLRLKAAGICQWCGRTPAKPGRNGNPGCRCEACAEVARVKSLQAMARRRPAWERLGVCVVCGCREAMQGRKSCGYCSERGSERRSQRRQEATAA